MSPRRSVADARDTRAAIVSRALEVASTQGLEGLTIGGLAHDLGMSKAGVIGHFGTKLELQLATLRAAIDVFLREVWQPAEPHEPGLPRLSAIIDAWVSYLERRVFPGGCFLTAAASEFDGRPGPVRDSIAGSLAAWQRTLAREAETARRARQLPRAIDPELLAFQLNAFAIGINQSLQLFDRSEDVERGRAAMHALLASPTARRGSRNARAR